MKSPSLLLVGVVLAAAAAFLVHSLQSDIADGERAAAGGEAAAIVVAARDLSIGHRLASEDLRESERTRSMDTRGGFRAAESLVGRILVVPRRQGEVIRESDLARRGSGAAIAEQLSPGQRAITLTLRDSGPGVVLFPGAIVDVLATVDRPTGTAGRRETITRTVLERCRVLAVNDEAVGSRAVDESGRRTAVNRLTVTLAVSPAEAALLQLASSRGSIGVVLRGDGDLGEGLGVVATPDALAGLFYEELEPPPSSGSETASAPPPPAPALWEVVVVRGKDSERVSFPSRRPRSDR